MAIAAVMCGPAKAADALIDANLVNLPLASEATPVKPSTLSPDAAAPALAASGQVAASKPLSHQDFRRLTHEAIWMLPASNVAAVQAPDDRQPSLRQKIEEPLSAASTSNAASAPAGLADAPEPRVSSLSQLLALKSRVLMALREHDAAPEPRIPLLPPKPSAAPAPVPPVVLAPVVPEPVAVVPIAPAVPHAVIEPLPQSVPRDWKKPAWIAAFAAVVLMFGFVMLQRKRVATTEKAQRDMHDMPGMHDTPGTPPADDKSVFQTAAASRQAGQSEPNMALPAALLEQAARALNSLDMSLPARTSGPTGGSSTLVERAAPTDEQTARDKLAQASEFLALGDITRARALANEALSANDAAIRDEAQALLAKLP